MTITEQPKPSEVATPPNESERRGALVLRALPILFIPAVVTTITFLLLRGMLGEGFLPAELKSRLAERPSPLIPIVVIVVFCTALIVLVRLGRGRLSALVLITVWTLVTTVKALQAGIHAPWPALLIIPICAAGLLIDGAASVSLALMATLLVGSIGWLEVQGTGFDPDPGSLAVTEVPALTASYWIGLFWSVAALTWLLAGGMRRALDQSRAQAGALRRLSSDLERRVEEQTEALLAQSREAATLEERARLAREIHDTLAQGLTGVVVQLGAAQRALEAGSDASGSHVALAQRMAREALAEARRSVWNLRSPALERGDLDEALRNLAAHPLRPETDVRFRQTGEPLPLPPAVESALLRICQEALVNVAKHARATQARIQLGYGPQQVQLTIQDNGVGFAETVLAPAAPVPDEGFGLLGMRERVAKLGGKLELVNQDGALVRVVIPYDGSERKQAHDTYRRGR